MDASRRPQLRTRCVKTKLCKFHLSGQCDKGGECRFAHSPDELQAVPDLSCTKVCPRFMRLGFCSDSKCKYAHERSELRVIRLSKRSQPRQATPGEVKPQVAKAAETTLSQDSLSTSASDVAQGVWESSSTNSGEESISSAVDEFLPMKVVPQWIHQDMTTTGFAQARPPYDPQAQGGTIPQPKFSFSGGLPYAPLYLPEGFSKANSHGQSTPSSDAAVLELARFFQVPSRPDCPFKAHLANSVLPKDQDYSPLMASFGTRSASTLQRAGVDPMNVELPDTVLGA